MSRDGTLVYGLALRRSTRAAILFEIPLAARVARQLRHVYALPTTVSAVGFARRPALPSDGLRSHASSRPSVNRTSDGSRQEIESNANTFTRRRTHGL